MENDLTLQPIETTSCGSCYTKVNSTDAFCDNCGYPLKGTESEQQSFVNNRTVKEIDLEDYNKKIKSAGTTLYWVAGVCVISGIIQYAMGKDEDLRLADLIIYLVLSMVFIALASWSRKKPFAAIVSGASLYGILLILNAIANPLSIVSGIWIKIIIIGALIKGINSAIEAEKIKKELNVE